MRLNGTNGLWTCLDFETGADITGESLFTLSASYAVWKMVLQQTLDPVRGVFEGRLRVRGPLASLLRWAPAFPLMVAIAGDLPTRFIDEAGD